MILAIVLYDFIIRHNLRVVLWLQWSNLWDLEEKGATNAPIALYWNNANIQPGCIAVVVEFQKGFIQ